MDKSLTNPLSRRPRPLNNLLSVASQKMVSRFDAMMAAAGLPDLRAAHSPIFMGIEAEGTRVTDLAERASMTKQAAGELVGYLAHRGYVTISPDPSDGRAKLVRLTGSGWDAIVVGEKVVADFDKWLDDLVGADEVLHLRAILATMAD